MKIKYENSETIEVTGIAEWGIESICVFLQRRFSIELSDPDKLYLNAILQEVMDGNHYPDECESEAE